MSSSTESPWCSTREAAAIARLHPRTLLAWRRRYPTILNEKVCSYELGQGGFKWHRERLIQAFDHIRHNTGGEAA